jgi:hypothetical protein
MFLGHMAAGLFWALVAAGVGLAFGLFFLWAAWFDRHREVVPA